MTAQQQRDWHARELARLEAIRHRPLTEPESLMLERCICVTEGRRIPHQVTRELARSGVGRHALARWSKRTGAPA